ncbi:MAG: hypothetical protein ACREAA_01900 [Candidatus Polarisedimenticolia bacterium]
MRQPAFMIPLILALVTPAMAAGPDPYTLRKDSRYESGCFAPCECPVLIRAPLQGRFRLAFDHFDGLFDHYRVEDVHWVVPQRGPLHVTGSGTYRVGGEFALQHQLSLDLAVGDTPVEHYDSGLVQPPSAFPRIDARISLHGEFCHDTVFAVHARPVRNMDVNGAGLTWEALPAADGHDIVRGSLLTLRATSGDFAAAVQECVAENVGGDWVAFSPDPPPGEGYWFLLRDREDGIAGSYDAGEPAQVGSADALLEASPLACP